MDTFRRDFLKLAIEKPDSRPVFRLNYVDGADFFRINAGKGQNAAPFHLKDVSGFRIFGSRDIKDFVADKVDQKEL